MSDPRILATRILERVLFEEAYSHLALDQALQRTPLDDRDAALCTTLVYGTLTWLRRLDAELKPLINRDLDGLDRPVLLSLRMALYQIIFLDRVPEHAAVDRAVEISKKRCGRGASGFTNGVLRNWLRKRKSTPIWKAIDPDREPTRYLGVRYSLPDWLAAYLLDQSDFPRAEARAAALTKQAPLYLRLTDAALAERSDHEVLDISEPVEAMPLTRRAATLSAPIRQALQSGDVVIQDLGSQLITEIATRAITESSPKVLDACAGLGGKTLYLAQRLGPQATIAAVDPHRSKLDALMETADTTGFSDQITPHESTLGAVKPSNGGHDLVLVDAPCTGLGVIRRHPETRWRRSPDDIADRSALQTGLLAEAAAHVAPGAHLMYSVCTFTDEEGPQVIDQFLADHPDFERCDPRNYLPDPYRRAVTDQDMVRLDPADFDCDAFFGALLRRTPDDS